MVQSQINNFTLQITHFIVRNPMTDRWIPLVAVSRAKEAKTLYFIGRETFRPLFIDYLRAREEISILPMAYDWPEEKCLWLTPEDEVFLANELYPMNDPDRVKIANVSECASLK